MVDRVLVGTWNVGGKCPRSEEEVQLKEWESREADIYVMG